MKYILDLVEYIDMSNLMYSRKIIDKTHRILRPTLCFIYFVIINRLLETIIYKMFNFCSI